VLLAGIDQGGLLKDLIEEILQTGFDPNFGFMQATAQNQARCRRLFCPVFSSATCCLQSARRFHACVAPLLRQ
jgi:hypothetical protein